MRVRSARGSTGDNAAPCSDDHLGCAPAGGKLIGETCTYGAPGQTGFDDCVGGAICIEGTCHTICDYQYGMPYCPDDLGCAKHEDFGPATAPDFPLAGICVPTCDPLADNDFDGSGSASARTGSACGPDPSIGCYGRFLNGGAGTEFTCARPVPGTENYVHRSAVPPAQSARTACHPGYLFAITLDTTGSTEFSCHAICRPGNSYAGAVTQEPNGQPGHECRADSSGRSGSFGTPATATENGEHCMYSWVFELDETGAIHRSATSDTVGICWDHTHYTIDHDGDQTTPQIAMPACATLPLHPATGLGAEAFGCVESALAGHANNRAPIVLPRM